jgi:hypothetical protein
MLRNAVLCGVLLVLVGSRSGQAQQTMETMKSGANAGCDATGLPPPTPPENVYDLLRQLDEIKARKAELDKAEKVTTARLKQELKELNRQSRERRGAGKENGARRTAIESTRDRQTSYFPNLRGKVLEIGRELWNGGCLINFYSPDPQERVNQLIKQSEDLRTIQEEWQRIWAIDQPSHLTPNRVDGGMQ